MFAVERQQKILTLIAENGRVTIPELEALFNTSHETIRKDLLHLERQNALKRIYGGAVSVESYGSLLPLADRKIARVAEKNELCRYAAQLIQEGDIIAIDEGSTAVELAKIIASRFEKLTVLTHNIEVFHILAESSRFSLSLCGGSFFREERAFGGHLAAQIAGQLHTRKAFICPAAVSKRFGITDFEEAFLPVQKSYVNNTDHVVVLADSRKFEISSKYKICDVSSDITLVTDSRLGDHIFHAYEEAQIEIIRS